MIVTWVTPDNNRGVVLLIPIEVQVPGTGAGNGPCTRIIMEYVQNLFIDRIN